MERDPQTGQWVKDNEVWDEEYEDISNQSEKLMSVMRDKEIEANQAAQQNFSQAVFQKTLEAKKMTQQDYQQADLETRADVDALYYHRMGQLAENAAKKTPTQPSGQAPMRPAQPTGDMGFVTAGKGGITSERVGELKEKGQKTQLSDAELTDLLDGILT